MQLWPPWCWRPCRAGGGRGRSVGTPPSPCTAWWSTGTPPPPAWRSRRASPSTLQHHRVRCLLESLRASDQGCFCSTGATAVSSVSDTFIKIQGKIAKRAKRGKMQPDPLVKPTDGSSRSAFALDKHWECRRGIIWEGASVVVPNIVAWWRIIEASELYGHSSYFRKKLKTLYYLEKIFSCKLK